MRRRAEIKEIVATLVLSLSALWLIWLIWNLGSKAELAWRQASETKAEYQQLEARKSALEANLDALNTPRGQDAALRQAFGVARPGEEVIIVVPPARSASTSTPPWWQQMFSWL